MTIADKLLDMTDDGLIEAYLEDKKIEKEVGVRIKAGKVEAFNRLDERGKKTGDDKQHREMETTSYTIKKEARITKSVIPSKAVAFFEGHDWKDEIMTIASISIRKGVDPKDIPADVLSSMDKFFDIEVTKTVDKEVMEKKVQQKEMTSDEFKSCIKEKPPVYALKITKK